MNNTKNNLIGLKNEGLRVFGAWEPLSFRIRSWAENSNWSIEDEYAWEHTEEFIIGLKERGFNLIITSFSKGRGISAEAEEREDTKKVAQLCHKHGLYIGGYIRYNTLIPETLKLDYPDCIKTMASIGSKGMPRYFDQYWRYVPCPSSTEYLEYLDKLIGIGIDDIGLDCLHVDGLDLPAEPYACHCPRCLSAFHDWLLKRYPTANSQKQRFGFTPIDYVEIPDITIYESPDIISPIISDPVAQEWMFFRSQQLVNAWEFIVNSTHSRNPDCYIQANAVFCPNVNPLWVASKNLSKLAQAGNNGFFTEEGIPPELYPDGRLHGNFETFKKLRQLNLQTFTYNDASDPDKLKREMAHQMAFNLDSAGVFIGEKNDEGKWPVTIPEYMMFHRDNRELFLGTTQAHDIAIYYSEQNYALNSGTPLATQNLARDVMMRGHVPFGYLLAEKRDEMKEFTTIVLPEVESLSDDEADDIASYVVAGGGLLVIGANTGRYNEYRRLRKENALTSRLGIKWDEKSSSFIKNIGKGRVAFLSALQSPEGLPAELVNADQKANKTNYLILRTELWRLPINSNEMLKLLEWTNDGYCFDVIVPNSVVVEFTHQTEQECYLIHLVNYDLEHDVGSFEIKCNIPVRNAQTFTPDSEAPNVKIVNFAENKTQSIQVAGFKRYLIIRILV